MKIEMKGSLWKVTITSGCYSDWESNTIVVSANTYDEAKNAVKIYYQENINDKWGEGLIFSDGEKWQYKGEKYEKGDSKYGSPFETDYGRGENVIISRLEVVYDGGEIAKKSLHLI